MIQYRIDNSYLDIWVSKVKLLLSELGFSFLWNNNITVLISLRGYSGPYQMIICRWAARHVYFILVHLCLRRMVAVFELELLKCGSQGGCLVLVRSVFVLTIANDFFLPMVPDVFRIVRDLFSMTSKQRENLENGKFNGFKLFNFFINTMLIIEKIKGTQAYYVSNRQIIFWNRHHVKLSYLSTSTS